MRSYIGIFSMAIAYTLMYLANKLIHATSFEAVDVLALLIPWALVGAMCVLWLRASQKHALAVQQGKTLRCEVNSAAIELASAKKETGLPPAG